jgi:hypothetical protein
MRIAHVITVFQLNSLMKFINNTNGFALLQCEVATARDNEGDIRLRKFREESTNDVLTFNIVVAIFNDVSVKNDLQKFYKIAGLFQKGGNQ